MEQRRKKEDQDVTEIRLPVEILDDSFRHFGNLVPIPKEVAIRVDGAPAQTARKDVGEAPIARVQVESRVKTLRGMTPVEEIGAEETAITEEMPQNREADVPDRWRQRMLVPVIIATVVVTMGATWVVRGLFERKTTAEKAVSATPASSVMSVIPTWSAATATTSSAQEAVMSMPTASASVRPSGMDRAPVHRKPRVTPTATAVSEPAITAPEPQPAVVTPGKFGRVYGDETK